MSNPQSNAIDAELAAKYLALDDESVAELLSLQMDYMGECAAVRDAQKRHFEMAVAEGMPEKAWRAYLKEHRIKAKAAKQIENLYADAESKEVRETAEMIREALGADYASLPLGAFTLARAVSDSKDDAPVAPKKRGRPSKKGAAPLVGEDDGSSPKTGADDEPDLRSTRQRNQEAARIAENEERLKGIKALDEKAAVH